jgi:hypothetical protein
MPKKDETVIKATEQAKKGKEEVVEKTAGKPTFKPKVVPTESGVVERKSLGKKGKVEGNVALKEAKKPSVLKPTAKTKKRKLKVDYWVKYLVLGVINLMLIVILVVILSKLPSSASKLNRLREISLGMAIKTETEIAESEIQSSKEKTDELTAAFPNEEGLVEFVREIEKLKEEGVVKDFSFTSKEVVRDKTGFLGTPVVIEFSGSWSQIDAGLQKLQSLPILFRAVRIEAEKTSETLIDLKYGGFIYVDESLGKD